MGVVRRFFNKIYSMNLKYKQPLYLLIISFLTTTIQAQSWTWATPLGSVGIETSGGIVVDNQKNIYCSGTFGANLNTGGLVLPLKGIEDVFLSKLDSNGVVDWVVSGGSLDRDDVTGMAIDNNKDLYITGTFWDTATFDNLMITAGTGLNAIFLAKYNETGTVVWAKSIQGSDLKICTDVETDANGNIYLTGYFKDSLFVEDSVLVGVGENDAFLVKFDTNGNLIWVQQFGYQLQTWATSLAINSLGEVYITGQFNGRIIFGTDTLWAESFDFDLFLVKYDANGVRLFHKYIGGVFDNVAPKLALDNADNLYMTGNFVGLITLDNFQFQTIAFDTDIFVTQLSSTGQVIWAKQYGGGNNDIAEAVIANHNQIIISGRYQSGTTIETVNFTTMPSDNNGLIFNLDSDGTFNWAMEIPNNGNSTIKDIAFLNTNGSELVTSGTYVNTGNFGSIAVPNLGFSDVFVSKIQYTPTFTQPIQNQNIGLDIFPNPASNHFQINLKNQESTTFSIKIFNTTGQLLKTYSKVLPNEQIDIHDLNQGIYFIQLTDNNPSKNNTITRKLIKY